jgi:ribosomal protein L7/L12
LFAAKERAMKDFFDRFCASLNQQELAALRDAVWKAEDRLIRARVEKGEFKKPCFRVFDYIQCGKKIDAIKEYRIQTRCNLYEAKGVVEYYFSLSSGRLNELVEKAGYNQA